MKLLIMKLKKIITLICILTFTLSGCSTLKPIEDEPKCPYLEGQEM